MLIGRAITIGRSIQKRSLDPINKFETKNEAKMLGATYFAIVQLKER